MLLKYILSDYEIKVFQLHIATFIPKVTSTKKGMRINNENTPYMERYLQQNL